MCMGVSMCVHVRVRVCLRMCVCVCVYMLWRIRVWHDSFICAMTHWCYVSWLIHAWRADLLAPDNVSYVPIISHMKASRHTYETKSGASKSVCHACMSRATYCECVISYMNETCHTRMSHGAYETYSGASNRACRISHMNESCHTIWMSRVTHGWVVLHINTSYSTRMSFFAYGWVMVHVKWCIWNIIMRQ